MCFLLGTASLTKRMQLGYSRKLKISRISKMGKRKLSWSYSGSLESLRDCTLRLKLLLVMSKLLLVLLTYCKIRTSALNYCRQIQLIMDCFAS